MDEIAFPVNLIGVALGAEGYEDGEIAEVIEVVINGRNTERTEVGEDYRTVEGGYVEEILAQKPVVVSLSDGPDCKAENRPRQLEQALRNALGARIRRRGENFVHRGVHCAVYIKDGVGRLKAHLGQSFFGLHAKPFFYHHVDLYVEA